MECCSCEATKISPGDFPGWQLMKQPVRRQRCRECVSRLLHATRTAWREEKIHRLHNASPNMMAAFTSLPASEQQRRIRLAESHLNSWQETAAEHRRQARLGGGGFSSYTIAATNSAFEVLEWSRLGELEDVENEVCIVRNVLSDAECDAVLEAISSRAVARGGWQSDRHKFYPTTDMRCADACADAPDIESMVRAAVFAKVCTPLATRFAGGAFLAEDLVFEDLFFVHYCASTPDGQRSLNLHADGSLFTFNLLLTDPSGFEGGGTIFSHPGWPEGHGHTVRVPRGAALVHSGGRVHGGREITHGTRNILVGFMGLPKLDPRLDPDRPLAGPFSSNACAVAARESFYKFGNGAWSRSLALCEDDGSDLPLSAGEV
jgi:hypothetical protein